MFVDEEPAQVQDPPAAREGQIAGQPAAQERVRMARATANDRAGNEDLIREALRNRGQPYVWGGASRGGFDCSGFICYIFNKKRGMKLPHSASAQARYGTAVNSQDLQPGDVVFFRTYRRGISHVGMYIGDNRFIHAANSRKDVRIDTLTGYYGNRLKAARRYSPAPIRFTPEDLSGYLREASVPPDTQSDSP
jgi:cell wall-associated NlpC family hydrolase